MLVDPTGTESCRETAPVLAETVSVMVALPIPPNADVIEIAGESLIISHEHPGPVVRSTDTGPPAAGTVTLYGFM
jgi:hypothetical protein